MTEFVEVNTGDLSGAALDWAVAKAAGEKVTVMPGMAWKTHHVWTAGSFKLYSPTTDWSQAGPVIEKIKIGFGPVRSGWVAHPHRPNAPTEWLNAGEPLVAICRAIVADKLGMSVRVPKELMP
ncbi:phage protein NinX family protein [Pseudomonas sp. AN3A02]|uniref:phage protein NinX family protein n=1 Tax=Pseudomonas sp. AN3A02 TaxID=2719587 RepID=UPI0014313D6A|nr:phage protein NinX family protein [Pseudomonas sp. AN3A02]NIL19711.1 DUF2591 family protein [Pseudomonas sp. AN3A02]